MTPKRRAALVRMERVVERAKAKQARVERASPRLVTPEAVEVAALTPASEPTEIVAPVPVQLSSYDEARVFKWIRDRLIDWPPGSCRYCRLPIAYGQP